jgi:tellurite resistance protein TehA-like permease
LGEIVYIYTILLFLAISLALVLRFVLHPPALKHVFLHPQESSFLCCLPLAFATLIANTVIYASRDVGFWITKTCLVLWLIFLVSAIASALVVPLLQWKRQYHPLEEWMPTWVLPPLSVVFNGSVAYEICSRLPPYTAIWVIILSYILVGFGLFIGLLYISGWVIRLVSHGAPPLASAPVFCIVIGPLAWASYSFIGLGYVAESVFPTAYPDGPFLGNEMSGVIFSVSSFALGLVFYGLSWFFVGTALIYFVWGMCKGEVALSKGALNNFGLTFPLCVQKKTFTH